MNIYYLQKENEEKEKVPCKTNPQENQKNEEIISPNPSSEKERKGKEKRVSSPRTFEIPKREKVSKEKFSKKEARKKTKPRSLLCCQESLDIPQKKISGENQT